MADRLPTRPPRTNWGNLSKNLALWLLVGLGRGKVFFKRREWRLLSGGVSIAAFAAAAYVGMRGGWEGAVGQYLREAAAELGISLTFIFPENGTPRQCPRMVRRSGRS